MEIFLKVLFTDLVFLGCGLLYIWRANKFEDKMSKIDDIVTIGTIASMGLLPIFAIVFIWMW